MVTVSVKKCDNGDVEVMNLETGDTGLIVPVNTGERVRESSVRQVLEIGDSESIKLASHG